MRAALVIPCFNEEHRLKPRLLKRFLIRNPAVDLYLVDDGSIDNTSKTLESIQTFSPERIFLLKHEQNLGKGHAVRTGIMAAYFSKEYELLGFWDADFATPLEEYQAMENAFQQRPLRKMVLGSRILKLGHRIKRKKVRHYLGRIFATFASLTVGIPVYDTQCGAKLMRQEVILTLFEKPFHSSWFFDLELLYRVKPILNNFHSELYEYAITRWEDKEGSKIKKRDFLLAPFELVKLYFLYR